MFMTHLAGLRVLMWLTMMVNYVTSTVNTSSSCVHDCIYYFMHVHVNVGIAKN